MEPGTQLGPYEILEPLGKGGMGEVYRARDTKLHRDVALKVLPETFAAEPERLARFEREARTLATLNHQHIAQVYGLEQTDTAVIVMELVEGQDLAERLEGGPLPLEEALPIARQIAEALDAAHEAGVVHRDLKPANVRVRPDGTVKVLDFGLAKVAETTADSSTRLADSPTLMSPATTGAGVILGTAAYMAPEQAKGQPLGPRADIWAFGVMLHEMLTGRRLFAGETVAETLAAVLRGEIDLDDVPKETPASIRWLIERCLQRDPVRRLGAISEAVRVLDDPHGALPVTTGPMTDSSRSLAVGPIVGSLVLGAALSAIGFTLLGGESVSSRNIQRFTLPTEGTASDFRNNFGRAVFLSSDGSLLSYTDPSTVPSTQWVRPIGGLESTRLPLQNVSILEFSPDGAQYAALSDEGFVRGAVDGGSPEVIAERSGGMAWAADGSLLFLDGRALGRVSPLGEPERLVDIQGSDAYSVAMGLTLLPGDRVALTTAVRDLSSPEIQTVVLAVSLESGEILAEVLPSAAAPTWIPTGHLLFTSSRATMLFAVPFDPATLAVAGEPVAVVRDLSPSPIPPLAQYAVAADGTLAYVQDSDPPQMVRGVVRLAPDGASERFLLEEDDARLVRPRLSPGGRRLAVQLNTEDGSDIWVYDLDRAGARLLLTEAGNNYDPVWSGDGQWIYYSRLEGDREQLFVRRADGGGPPRQVVETDTNVTPHSWHPGGTRLAVYQREDGPRDIAILHLDEEPVRMEEFLATPANERSPVFSPDGRWLAYASDTSGRDEVYLTDYPERSVVRVVSTAGGREPVWAPAGGALFYRSLAFDEFFRVEVQLEPELLLGAPERFAWGRYVPEVGSSGSQSYDVAADGSLIVLGSAAFDDSPGTIVVVTNWFEELKRLVPVDR